MGTAFLAPDVAFAVPSFARQSGQPCQSRHTVVPELTPYGRRFKLGGYTASVLPQIQGAESGENLFSLNQMPPLSAMFVTSITRTQRPFPILRRQTVSRRTVSCCSPQTADSLMIGAYVLETRQLPGSGSALSGSTGRLSDTAIDAQFQHVGLA